MTNLNNKILWAPCCSNGDPGPLENQNQNEIENENQNENQNEIENPVSDSEITNDPFFQSAVDGCFVRYLNFCVRQSVTHNLIDSIIDDFLDDLIRSASDIGSSSANQKNGGINPNHNSDTHNGESEDPSTSENSDTHNGENEEPSTSDNSDDQKGENEEPSTNDNSDDQKGENEEPSTNERETIDYGAFWVQCETCYGINYKRLFFQSRLNICEHCGCHLRVDSPERIELSIDPGTWNAMDKAGKEDSIDPGTRDAMDEDKAGKEDSIDPGTRDAMDEDKAGKEDSIDPGTRDAMDEDKAGKEDEDMSVLDPIEWDWDPESDDDENEEDSEDEWDLDSDLYSYSDPDPDTDPEEESEKEEEEKEEEEKEKEDPEKEKSDPDEEDEEEEEEESDPDEEDPDEEDEEDPDEEDPDEEEKEDPEKEDPEKEKEDPEKEEEEKEEEEWDEEEWDEEPDPWDKDQWNPRDPKEQEQKKKKEDPEEEEDWSWLEIEEEEVEVEDKPYIERIFSCQDETELSEAVQTGLGQINGIPVAIGVMDFRFIGGSMGCVVGEKITRLIEYATNQILPLILVCASGGARMYEGSLSLMQMAKISAALYDYKSTKKSFYISILTTPTTGGVTASFGMLGDIIISEPDAYIAFAGKRVIEQTLNIEVPEGSQTAEVLFENGLLDPIVPRNPLKDVLDELLQLHNFSPLNKKE
uniref:Acetyl-coenzyme A carboxylase carboxyl transferase subunit beta, chloroplastic n=1 Tax=Passiflora serrulata TaxID=237881 RepID=A0A7L7SH74_PASSU|nr:acetyl-CoA carboxylase beta subunit [Passiflora serrulata]QNZ92131.1 acetyl-CoA carboxylase beta subunit [Passiflora serrulata]